MLEKQRYMDEAWKYFCEEELYFPESEKYYWRGFIDAIISYNGDNTSARDWLVTQVTKGDISSLEELTISILLDRVEESDPKMRKVAEDEEWSLEELIDFVEHQGK